MKCVESKYKYRYLFDSFYEYAKCGYFKNNKEYRNNLLNNIKEYRESIERKFNYIRNHDEDCTSLIIFLTEHIIDFHEFLLFAYENVLLSVPKFKLKKDDKSESIEFIIDNNKYLIKTEKTKIKNPNSGNIALSMIYDNRNTDILEKREIKILDDTNQFITEFSFYYPFNFDNITKDEIIQLEIIVENLIKYINTEIDKILNHILHLYTNNNIDWKVVVNDGLWIRNEKPKKRYFK